MRRATRTLLTLLGLGLAVTQLCGCGFAQLRGSNRRLQEANDRLHQQASRLEQELIASERELAKARSEIGRLQDALHQPKRAEPQPASAQTFQDIGLESGTSSAGTWIRLDSAVFFPVGQAQLSSEGRRLLDSVAQRLSTEYGDRMIRVEGHTDDLPIRKLRHIYPTNWELSTARACSVVRYLESKGIPPQRLYPAGFSFHKPRVAGDSADSRQQNRRVEILILNEGNA